jgi:hypothetical protein
MIYSKFFSETSIGGVLVPLSLPYGELVEKTIKVSEIIRKIYNLGPTMLPETFF